MIRTLFYKLFLFTIILAVSFGCSKKDLSEERKDEGSVSLSFFVDGLFTKSPLVLNEDAISDLNIYVTDENSRTVFSHTYVPGSNISSSYASGIKVNSNKSQSIYVVANLGYSKPLTDVYNLLTSAPFFITASSVSDIAPSGKVVMFGKIENQQFRNGTTVSIRLIRQISKVSFGCDYSGLNPGVNVTVKSISLHQIPKKTSVNYIYNGNNNPTVVMDGESRSAAAGEIPDLTTTPVSFYMWSNMQGTVAPGATNNKEKEQLMSAAKKSVSTYVEMVYDYQSPTKAGTIIYRFFLGESYEDCNIRNNTHYHFTVKFSGDASADENSWSVDTEGLYDLVTGISLNPTSLSFSAINETSALTATISPSTAQNKGVVWSSSNDAVATVSSTGIVTAKGDGTCTITAASAENPSIKATCAVSVSSTPLAFSTNNVTIPTSGYVDINYSGVNQWSTLSATSTDESIAKLDIATTNKIYIRAYKAGTCTVTLHDNANGKNTSCNITVIDPVIKIYSSYDYITKTGTEATMPLTIHTGSSVNLTLVPEITYNYDYAANGTTLYGQLSIQGQPSSYSTSNINVSKGGNPEKDVVDFACFYSIFKFTGLNPIDSEVITIQLKQVSTVTADATFNVLPELSMPTDEIKVAINKGTSVETIDLGIDCDESRTGDITATWDGGPLPAGLTFDGKSLKFANPCSIDNVAHTLTVTLGSKSISRTVKVYQSAYLVVRSKSNGVDRYTISNGVRVTYNNELVANFYYSPILKNGSMVSVGHLRLKYWYNGSSEPYTEEYPGIYEDITYEFTDSNQYEYYNGDTFIYNKSTNNYPRGLTVFYYAYCDYDNKWQEGDDHKFYYIIERQFQGGLSQDNANHFKEVFERAYSNN